jgi:Zn-dependent protease with chaperone function
MQTESESAPIGTGAGSTVFFDGASSRKRLVDLTFAATLEIREAGELVANWPYGDIRRTDGTDGLLRAACETGPSLARLEIRDRDLALELVRRCPRFDEHAVGKRGVAQIVGWSLAALASIAFLVMYGLPYAAERLTPLIPQSVEQRIGQAADRQVRIFFDDKICTDLQGQAAFLKLVTTLRMAMGLETSIDAAVLGSDVPNAIALPGGKIYLFNGLLQKAENADEIAGVLAHELGHVRNRDSMRNMIYTGGTSFLIGLLFGDISGSSAVIFATRQLLDASYSRDVERSADGASVEAMHKLGRSTKPLGELLLRVTGKEGGEGKRAGKGISTIISSHPLSEERLARMSQEDRPVTGAPLLTAGEWASLKAICGK